MCLCQSSDSWMDDSRSLRSREIPGCSAIDPFKQRKTSNCSKAVSTSLLLPVSLPRMYSLLISLLRSESSKNCLSKEPLRRGKTRAATGDSELTANVRTASSRYSRSLPKVVPSGTSSFFQPGISAMKRGCWTAAGSGTSWAVSQSIMLPRY